MYYIFDVDMTLAESDCMMTPDHADIFRNWMKDKTFFLCSGSQMDKMKEQVPADILEKAAALFPCVGCEMWQEGQKVISHQFSWPEGLKEMLEGFLEESEYPEEKRTSDFIQDRISMVCFSVVGKAAVGPQRHAYTAYDKEVGERVAIAEKLRSAFSQLEVSIGGQVSIDISDKGKDKSQVLPVIRERFGKEPMSFFGDRMQPGGNDFPLAEALRAEPFDNKTYPVQGFHETMDILKKMTEEATA